VLELPGGTEGISTHCGCGPHVIHGVEGLGAIGASVLFPSAFFSVRPLLEVGSLY